MEYRPTPEEDFETWEEQRMEDLEREAAKEPTAAEAPGDPVEFESPDAMHSALEIRQWPEGKPWDEEGPVKQRAAWQQFRRSGRISLRMPASLHDQLSVVAAAERTSLNQFICNVLAGTVGWRAVSREEMRAAKEHSTYERWRDRFG